MIKPALLKIMTTSFCQAESVIFLGEPSQTLTPEDKTNLVFLSGGWEWIPITMWAFSDPHNPSSRYIAKFGAHDVPKVDGEIYARAEGRLFHIDETGEAIPLSEQKALMLIVGKDSKCNGICAAITGV